jgi:hypothetical protein
LAPSRVSSVSNLCSNDSLSPTQARAKPSKPENDDSNKENLGYIEVDGASPEPIPPVAAVSKESFIPNKTCGEVRQMLRQYMDRTGVKASDLQSEMGVSSSAWTKFMKATGPNGGSKSDTYAAALDFFAEHLRRGAPAVPRVDSNPNRKKRKSGDANTDGVDSEGGGASADDAAQTGERGSSNKRAKTTGSKTKKTGSKASRKVLTADDLADIALPGEEEDRVEVYETCDAVRRHMSDFLRRDGATQAQLCRNLSAMLHTERKVVGNTLQRFRGRRGPRSGATSSVFYAGYVFFEKLRIKEGKPKSKHRETMEQIWWKNGGFDRSYDSSRKFLCVGGERPYIDQYGQPVFR